ncbi:carboxypeptidase-like regulatory domain-containing protein [Mucilaginibacter sp. Mucisp86]|uniref:carboxypeptidase-like regulatory domain-containing protein n=1 Tax=Mucilaginibacter sp. Mucisp86 TaxID=3243060 RepID=UPI0039B4671B
MKKILFFTLITISKLSFAQTIAVNGTVTDSKGKPVPFAFVSDSQHPYATYSDPNGTFSLQADPASKLIITANFHNEVKVNLNSQTNIKVVMTGDSVSNNAPAETSNVNFFKMDDNIVDHNVSINRIGTGQEGLHGSRFLFNDWVHGFGITPKDSLKQSDVYLFNYDKVAGNLIFTRTKKTAMIVVKEEIKGFTLFDENAQPYVFEDVPAINPKKYVQVLSSGSKYKIYKDLGTTFIKASFSTNGITSSGNNYDEYKDEAVYYIVKAGAQPQKVELKSKAIKAAFPADADKVKKFFSDNEGDIDDNYLKALGDYLNQ